MLNVQYDSTARIFGHKIFSKEWDGLWTFYEVSEFSVFHLILYISQKLKNCPKVEKRKFRLLEVRILILMVRKQICGSNGQMFQA